MKKVNKAVRLFDLAEDHLRAARYPLTLRDSQISLRKLGKLVPKLQREVAILIERQSK